MLPVLEFVKRFIRKFEKLNCAVPPGLLDARKEMSPRRPYGTPSAFVETAFPTLKRGASNHCAYGADARTFLMQLSIKPAFLLQPLGVRAKALTYQP